MFEKIIGKKPREDMEPEQKNEYEERRRSARIAGLMYLSVIIFGISAQVVRMSLVDPDDAVATVESISSNGTLFRLSFLSDVVMTMSYLLLGVASYLLYRSFNDRIALVMLVIVVVSAAIGGVSLANHITVMHLLSGSEYMAALGAEQLQAQVMLQLEMHTSGSFIAQMVGWGPWLFPLGYLGYRSGYFPKVLGILLIMSAFGYVIEGVQYFLLPDLEVISYPGLMITAVTEFATCGWLLLKGVRVQAFAGESN